MARKTIIVIVFAVALFFGIIAVFSSFFPETISYGDKIAIVKLHGEITSASGMLFAEVASPDSVIKLLDQADKDSTIKAVVLEINSPGGSAVASDEIAAKVKSMNKTVVAWISDLGASGAYWVASASDKIVAHPLSLTCSIGAIAVIGDWSGFFEKYGFNFTTIKAGKYKDIGSMYKPMTGEERAILQGMILDVQTSFVDTIAENRNMERRDVEKIADGSPCLGKDALKYGLVDATGNEQAAIDLAQELAGIKKPKIVTLEPQAQGLLQQLSKITYSLGLGLGKSMQGEGLEIKS